MVLLHALKNRPSIKPTCRALLLRGSFIRILIERLKIPVVLLNRMNRGSFRGIVIKTVILRQLTIAGELEGNFLPTMFTED